jgi:hypothetical protein
MFDHGDARLSPMRLEIRCRERRNLPACSRREQLPTLPGVIGQDGVRLLKAGEFGFEITW